MIYTMPLLLPYDLCKGILFKRFCWLNSYSLIWARVFYRWIFSMVHSICVLPKTMWREPSVTLDIQRWSNKRLCHFAALQLIFYLYLCFKLDCTRNDQIFMSFIQFPDHIRRWWTTGLCHDLLIYFVDLFSLFIDSTDLHFIIDYSFS